MLTIDTIQRLIDAVHEMMTRCPGCYGVGRVRVGEGPTAFCLVCEDLARAMFPYDRDIQTVEHAFGAPDHLKPGMADLFRNIAREAKLYVYRCCPGCHGVRMVWAPDGSLKPCLVCYRFWQAVDVFETPTPIMDEAETWAANYIKLPITDEEFFDTANQDEVDDANLSPFVEAIEEPVTVPDVTIASSEEP